MNALGDALARRADGGWMPARQAEQALAVVRAGGGNVVIPEEWAARFGLDDTDLAILTVVAAVEQDVALHLLVGLLSGDPVQLGLLRHSHWSWWVFLPPAPQGCPGSAHSPRWCDMAWCSWRGPMYCWPDACECGTGSPLNCGATGTPHRMCWRC